MDKKINKKAQVVIWVIIAIFLVAAILLFLFIERRVSVPTRVVVEEINPNQFVDKCVGEYVNDAIDIMLPQGGFIEPGHSKLYDDINVAYLCYNRGSYQPCVNQHPMLLNEMKDEIKEYIFPKVDSCFNDLRRELEKRGSEIILSNMDIDASLGPGRVYIDINRDITINKQDESVSFDNFNIRVLSPAYDLARIAMEIASQEAKYCYFEYVGYMVLYPGFKINLFPMSDETKIYSISDKNSGKTMNIAIRGCAIPPGL